MNGGGIPRGKPWDRQPVSGKLRRKPGVSPGFAALRDGLHVGIRGPIYDLEAVRGDAYGGFGSAATHDESRGVQADETLIVEGGGPIDNQFQVAPEGKRPAAAETDSAGTHVLNRTDSPTGRGSLSREAETNGVSQHKTPFFTPLRHWLHIRLDASLCERLRPILGRYDGKRTVYDIGSSRGQTTASGGLPSRRKG